MTKTDLYAYLITLSRTPSSKIQMHFHIKMKSIIILFNNIIQNYVGYDHSQLFQHIKNEIYYNHFQY